MAWTNWSADWTTDGRWNDRQSTWTRNRSGIGWNSSSWDSSEIDDGGTLHEDDEDLSASAQFLGSTSTASGHKKGTLKSDKQGRVGCR